MTAMIDLAMNQDKGPVTLAGISERQQLSLPYLEQLFNKLRRNNIVQSTRGPGGGYTLAHFAEEISIAKIITAVDEVLDATQCGSKGDCKGKKSGESHCMTHNLWSTLNQKIFDYLDSVSLKDLIQQQTAEQPTVLITPCTKPHAARLAH